MKKIILLFSLLIPSISYSTTFSITLLTPAEAAVTKDAFVRFELHNYGSQVPHVVGSNVILPSMTDFYPNGSGVVTGTIQGNDTIIPNTTYYHICFYKDGIKFYCCDMVITGASVVIDASSCILSGGTPTPPVSCNQIINQCPITIQRRIEFGAAVCNGGSTATTAQDLPASNAMSPACASNGLVGVLTAQDGQSVTLNFVFPHDFISFADANVTVTTTDTTQNHTIIYSISRWCTPPNSADTTPSFDTPQNFPTITIPNVAVSGQSYSMVISQVNQNANCVPYGLLHLRFRRETDTDTDIAVQWQNFVLNYNGTTN